MHKKLKNVKRDQNFTGVWKFEKLLKKLVFILKKGFWITDIINKN